MTLQIIMSNKALLKSMQIESFDLNLKSEEIKLENKRLQGGNSLFLFILFYFYVMFS